jgi:hypothetical protein
MDPAQLSVIAHAAETVLGVFIVLSAPVAFVYTLKHFKLRHREIELEAELHGKQTQARLDSIEARLGVIESALGAISRNPGILEDQRARLEERRALLEAPGSSTEAPVPALKDPLRSR